MISISTEIATEQDLKFHENFEGYDSISTSTPVCYIQWIDVRLRIRSGMIVKKNIWHTLVPKHIAFHSEMLDWIPRTNFPAKRLFQLLQRNFLWLKNQIKFSVDKMPIYISIIQFRIGGIWIKKNILLKTERLQIKFIADIQENIEWKARYSAWIWWMP